MTLNDLLRGVEACTVVGDASVAIASVVCDSRRVEPGALFAALRGVHVDGNQFVREAAQKGAAAILSEQPAPAGWPASIAWVQVSQPRRALATVAANFYGRPAERLKLVGITGTNGKTTTTYLVDTIFRTAGLPTGMMGTVEYRLPDGVEPATHTTPESLDLQRFLARVHAAGGTHVVFEVSSHALAQDRVWGCRFAAAVFTNLTQDHLDYHGTLEDYFAAKRRLFEGTGAGAPAVGVLNADDPHSRELARLPERVLTYGLDNKADITARKPRLSFSGIRFTAETPAGNLEVRSPLVARINLYNLLAAIGVGLALGLDREAIAEGIARLERVPGRFERVEAGQPFLVVVDYAHTHDAIRNVIATARELNPQGRVIVVFGCGGERDRTKRPLMGEAAGRGADLVVLTNDNPRGEDPRLILNDVLIGLRRAAGNYLVEPDRARAIGLAFDAARAGDLVLLLGKGHERYQILGDQKLPWNEIEVARQQLAERGYRASSCRGGGGEA
ncbi:MAG: UDP-N-acetylmuramoyl-L-alanyl-D-glutamate--2,6-diaminopimelate ligase [Firmicutes bacterium]|nr:UDP-N-acetylmuramoyl-L-alanyl-D-glutamate--2,6-diaminopimelate ligase [Bacillota bacterium]